MKDDSIDGIYETLKQCALISKTAGGIGLSIHCIRASGSYIAGVNVILYNFLKNNHLVFSSVTTLHERFVELSSHFADKWQL